VYDTVAEFGEFAAVPTACRTYEVTCDSLELVDVLTTAVWTLCESLFCVFISAVHAAVAVVVH
jgi:hypothetical protein